MHYFWRSINRRRHMEVPILPEDGGGQKGELRWAMVGPPHPLARWGPLPRRQVVWGPWPTSAVPPSRTWPPRNPNTRRRAIEIFRRLHEAENTRERKAPLQEEICRGKFPPGGGNRRHHHRHRAGLHRDHHHHLHHQHHHHRRCTPSPL